MNEVLDSISKYPILLILLPFVLFGSLFLSAKLLDKLGVSTLQFEIIWWICLITGIIGLIFYFEETWPWYFLGFGCYLTGVRNVW